MNDPHESSNFIVDLSFSVDGCLPPRPGAVPQRRSNESQAEGPVRDFGRSSITACTRVDKVFLC